MTRSKGHTLLFCFLVMEAENVRVAIPQRDNIEGQKMGEVEVLYKFGTFKSGQLH